jgi:two-component system sensor histidine kinase KdpD
MQAHAISGPWAAGDRVLVCVDQQPRGASLIRYAKRQADRLRAPWSALNIETPRSAGMPEADKDRIATTLRLAEQLGGEAITLPGHDIAAEIIRHAAANNVTHIIIGKPTSPRWRTIFEGSVSQELIRRAGDISVHVISGDERDGTRARPAAAPEPRRFRSAPYLVSTALVGTALGLSSLIHTVLDVRNIALVFLMAVLASAVTSGLWPALFASVLSALTLNFFFLQPLYTLDIADPESAIALFFFLGVAIVASNLMARVQRQAAAARQRARTTEDLYLFSKKLAGTGTLDDVLWATAYQIASMLKVRVVILLPDDDTISVRAGYPPDDTLVDADIAAARWAWEHDRPAGRGPTRCPAPSGSICPCGPGARRSA